MKKESLDDIVLEVAEDIKRQRAATQAAIDAAVKRLEDEKRTPVQRAGRSFMNWWDNWLIPAFWLCLGIWFVLSIFGLVPEV
jgi:hypothetical protein